MSFGRRQRTARALTPSQRARQRMWPGTAAEGCRQSAFDTARGAVAKYKKAKAYADAGDPNAAFYWWNGAVAWEHDARDRARSCPEMFTKLGWTNSRTWLDAIVRRHRDVAERALVRAIPYGRGSRSLHEEAEFDWRARRIGR